MVDSGIVAERLRYINEYTNDPKRMRGMSMEKYIADIVTTSYPIPITLGDTLLAGGCRDFSAQIVSRDGHFSPVSGVDVDVY